MKRYMGIFVLATLLVLSFASCGGGPANEPETAAAVMVAATPMCIAEIPTSSLTVTTADSADFSESDHYAEVEGMAGGMHKAVFEDYEVCYDGKTYVVNGTCCFAYEFTANVTDDSGWHAEGEVIYYAESLSLSGPDFDSTFDADFSASIDFTMVTGVGSTAIEAAATVDGSVAGQVFANASLSLSATL